MAQIIPKDNNKCFQKLSHDHQQLWLNIQQNAKTINLFWKLDYDRFMCINCFKYLGTDAPNEGFNHCDGYCASFMCYAMFCNDCTEKLNLKTENGVISGSITCPICWYLLIKDNDHKRLKDIYTPLIELNQWQLVDIAKIHQSYGSMCDESEDDNDDNNNDNNADSEDDSE